MDRNESEERVQYVNNTIALSDNIYEEPVKFQNTIRRTAVDNQNPSTSGMPQTNSENQQKEKAKSANNQDQFTSRPNQTSSAKQQEEKGESRFPEMIWKVAALVGLLLAIVCIGLVISLMQRDSTGSTAVYFEPLSHNDKETTTATTSVETTTIYGGGTWFEPAKSCQELKLRGIDKDGIYVIRPSDETAAYQVFCDMTTSGGGWTLVASVHENNIDGKCTVGDKWSSEQGWTKSIKEGKGGNNWINLNTFGHIESATSADYKGLAYHNLKASNVMVWHVGNDVPMNRASEESYLKYYTDNSVLMKYGGSLKDLYKNLSVRIRSSNYIEDLVYPRTITGLNRISRLQNYVSNWYNYTYDRGTNATYIDDGGSDMYDSGNMVYHGAGNEFQKVVTYGESLRYFSSGYITSSYATHPFVFLMWIDSGTATAENFTIKIISNAGADGGGSFREYPNSRTYGTSTLYFHSFQIFGTSDPTICGVLFYVEDQTRWNSISPTSFVKDVWTNGTDDMTHSVTVTGKPSNIMMGYVLLSRNSGNQVSSSDISNVMDTMQQDIYNSDISKYKVHFYDKVVAPVQFAKGNLALVKSTLPPSITPKMYQTGFLQFGAETKGYDFLSLCPGIKIKASQTAEHMCVGSLRISFGSSYCGDYAGWAGRTGDVILQDRPSRYAHSYNDISSTLLIFTR